MPCLRLPRVYLECLVQEIAEQFDGLQKDSTSSTQLEDASSSGLAQTSIGPGDGESLL